jgi:tetratricopeptide (TPR) repeat protein
MSAISRYLLICSLLVGLSGSAAVTRAQGGRPESPNQTEADPSAFGSIRGRLLLPGGNYVSANVKVSLQTLRGTVAVIYADSLGQFEFEELRPGSYQLEIDPADPQKFEISTESVQVFKGVPSVVSLTLKEKKASARIPNAAKTVSALELGSEIPSGARKEFDRASKASRKGETDEAVAHLRRAIILYPNFVMAHNDLGAQLLGQGKLDEAAEELRTAISLDSNSFNPALNLGIVLVQQHKFSEAGATLEKALSIEPQSPSARLYSGFAFMALGKFEAAENDLKSAYEFGGAQFAVANFHLGQLYLNRGEKALARKSFQIYLIDVPNAANSDQARRMLAMLQ